MLCVAGTLAVAFVAAWLGREFERREKGAI
jgi:hypothetical protein